MSRKASILLLSLLTASAAAVGARGEHFGAERPGCRGGTIASIEGRPAREYSDRDDWMPGEFPLTIIDERRGELFEVADYLPRSGEVSVSPEGLARSDESGAYDLIPAEAFYRGADGEEPALFGDADLAWIYSKLDEPEPTQDLSDIRPARRVGADDVWRLVLLPEDLIYRSYLAGAKESRLGTQIMWDDDDLNPNTFLWEATLGARVGLLRFGSLDGLYPQGFQLDAEGSAQVRLDVLEDVDVRAVDFRGGIPLTYGFGRWQAKLAYYHLSAHLGDEFVIKNPTYDRLNFARDVFVFGLSYNVFDDLRLYGEIGYAFYTIVSEPWETQFGFDYAPARPTGFAGAPFVAANVHLREELDFSGNFTFQAGWAWRSDRGRKLVRVGLNYYNGLSSQNSFYQRHEQQIGIGLYYDF